jgi:hypothetical protein
MAHNLRSPNKITSYSTMLFVHLSVSFVNCKCVAYLSLMPEGDIRTVIAPTLTLPQAPSQYTFHDDYVIEPLV